jgi:hypothetical protein
MRLLHRNIRNCPPPLEFADVGHFVQEWVTADTGSHEMQKFLKILHDWATPHS